MKKLGILLLAVLICVGFSVRQAAAIQTDFGAGSLIIPMDSFYQPEADGGMLEGYGLVFSLLGHVDDVTKESDITVYWIINDQKVTIDGADFRIEDLTLTDPATEWVARLYNHAGGTTTLTFDTANGDDFNTITYAGAPFIIDAVDADKAKAIINGAGWSAVDVHEAQVPFSAPVYREMRGTPPRIALMNDSEDLAGGNAQKILESYLRLAGICTDVYDIVTPNQIRDGILEDGAGGYQYDFLWTPHWAGYEKSYGTDDTNNDTLGAAAPNGIYDVEDIVTKVREFVAGGNGVFAECASIEVFEHSDNGHFLTDKGFAQNGGWNDPAHVVHSDVTTPNSQIGDFAYEPTGGHLHNWRPFQFGDNSFTSLEKGSTIEYMKGALDSPQTTGAVTSGNDSVYNSTVNRFTMDDGADVDGSTWDDNWDYYVGGYLDGDTSLGYVVYLGGHKYANECTDATSASSCTAVTEHRIQVTFAKNLSSEQFSLVASEAGGTSPAISFNAADGSYDVHNGTPLELHADGTTTVSGNQINDLLFANLGTANLANVGLNLTWAGDTDSDGQYITEVRDTTTGAVLYQYTSPTSAVSGLVPEKTDTIKSTKKNEYKMKLVKAYDGETFTMKIYHNQGVDKYTEISFQFEDKDGGAMININFVSGYDKLVLESGKFKSGKQNEAEEIKFKNNGAGDLTIRGIQISWSGGNADQNIDEFKREKRDGNEDKIKYKTGNIPGVVLGTPAEPTSISPTTPFTIDADCVAGVQSCTDNSSCSATNVAGVRYVLNTLFNIKYLLTDNEFSRASPVVDDEYLYYGTFDYPSYRGHFRKVDVQAKNAADQLDFSAGVEWDTGAIVANDSMGKHIEDAGAGNNDATNSTRQVFTADNSSGSWTIIDFDKPNIDALRTSLDVTPTPPSAGGDDTDEFAVIDRVRGMFWDKQNSVWKENTTANGGNGKRLGAIMHSAPAVVGVSDRTGRIYNENSNNFDDRNGVYYDYNHDLIDDGTGEDLSFKSGAWVDLDGDNADSERLETRDVSSYTFVNGVWERPEVAYVGSLDGMLHAIDTSNGDELWAFIPRNLLGKLQNDRTDENATQDFAGVDSSPTVKDVFYDHDDNPATPDQWRTILSCAEGNGGTSLFVMDVTDPDDPIYFGEFTDPTMGYARRTSIGKVKVPVYHTDANGNEVFYAKDNEGNYIYSSDGYGNVLYSINGGSSSYWVWQDADGDGTSELVSYTGAVPFFTSSPTDQGFIKDYEIKWMVFAATNYPGSALTHGGIRVYGFELLTGNMVWSAPFSEEYASSVNDIPGAVTVFDDDGDDFIDRVFVGDNEGRLWVLNASDGSNPFGTTYDSTTGLDGAGNPIVRNVPLYNAGVGQPISVSPAVATYLGQTYVAFGTGGADWADPDGVYEMILVNATRLNENRYYNPGAGFEEWVYTLPQGEKVWASPVIVGSQVIFATATGFMNSDDPRKDLEGTGYLRSLDLSDGTLSEGWSVIETGKSPGLYAEDGHVYITDNKGGIAQVGSGTFDLPPANNVDLRRWRQL